MDCETYHIVRTALLFSFFLLIVHPCGAGTLSEDGSHNDYFPDISCFFSGIIDVFYDTDSNAEGGNGGDKAKQNDIFATIENISLVIYEEPGIRGDIGDYIKENINSSVSQEIFSENNGLQRDLYILLSELRLYSDGFTVDGFEIFIYPLVTDEDLRSPSVLSRPNGLKITLYVDSVDERKGKTVCVYEKYSTDIIRGIYDAGYGEEFGTVYIKFTDLCSGEEITHMVLDAADAEVSRAYWNDPDSYIGVGGWSEVEFSNEYDLTYYEDSLNRISADAEDFYPAETDSGNNSFLSDGAAISYDSLLTNSISGSYDELVSRIDDIGEYCNEDKRSEIINSANDLGRYLYELRTVVKDIPVSGSLYDEKLQYLNALEKISSAASDYWYFAVHYDSESLSRALENSGEGLVMLNNLADGLDMDTVDLGSLDKATSGVTNSLSMFEPFHYRDASGSNDISFKVMDWGLKNSLLTKNIVTGEQNTFSSEYNTDFLLVTVVFTHLGYRGGGPEQIVTPPETSFKLQYGGNEYIPLTFNDYLENSGVPYRSKTVDRKEIYESVLVFEMKNDFGQAFDGKEAYIVVDLGNYGNQMWNLEK